MEKWAVFANHWKSRKLLLILLTMFWWTEVLLKKVWEAFWANPCLPRQFLVCIILECFVKFLDDPYYEPLPWFMIYFIKILAIYLLTVSKDGSCYSTFTFTWMFNCANTIDYQNEIYTIRKPHKIHTNLTQSAYFQLKDKAAMRPKPLHHFQQQLLWSNHVTL